MFPQSDGQPLGASNDEGYAGVEMVFVLQFAGLEHELKFHFFPTMDDLKMAIHVKIPEVPLPNQRILIGVNQPGENLRILELLDLDPYVTKQRESFELLTFFIWVEDSQEHEVPAMSDGSSASPASDGWSVAEMRFLVHFEDLERRIDFPIFPTLDDLKMAIHTKFPGVPPPNQRISIGVCEPGGGNYHRVQLLDLNPYVAEQRMCNELVTFIIWVEDSHAHEVMRITVLPLEEPGIADMVMRFTPDQTVGYVKLFYMLATGRDYVRFYLQEGGDVNGAPVQFGSPWLFTDDAATLRGRGISNGSVLVAVLEGPVV